MKLILYNVFMECKISKLSLKRDFRNNFKAAPECRQRTDLQQLLQSACCRFQPGAHFPNRIIGQISAIEVQGCQVWQLKNCVK